MTSRDASHVARTGRRLSAAPVTAGAWLDGSLSGGQVGAITANVGDDTASLWAEHEADMVPVLAALPVTDVAAAMRAWAARAEATLGPARAAGGEALAAPVEAARRASRPEG
jgi:hypothetical protein